MGALEFWASIASSAAWPIAVVLIVVILHKPLGRLIDRIKHVDLPGGTSADFHEQAERAELLGTIVVNDSADAAPGALTASADQGQPPSPPEAPPESGLLESLLIAEQYVQRQLLDALGRLGQPIRNHTPFSRLASEARKVDLLTEAEMQLLASMRRLRNQAVHESVASLNDPSLDVELLVSSINQIAINVWSRSVERAAPADQR